MKKVYVILVCTTMLLVACSSQKKDIESVNQQISATPTSVSQDTVTPATIPDQGTPTVFLEQVKDYIMNGQEDLPEAGKINWSETFLDKVDMAAVYDQYITNGGEKENVQIFAQYLTDNAPVDEDWQTMFQQDLKDTYGVEVSRLEAIDEIMYQAYIMEEDKEIPYVAVNSRTGYFHG